MDIKPFQFIINGSETRFIILSILVLVMILGLMVGLMVFSVSVSEESDKFEDFNYINGTSPEGIVNETDALNSHAQTLRSSSYRVVNSLEDIEYLYNRSSGVGIFNSENSSVFEDYVSNTTVLATNLSSSNPKYDSQELTEGMAPYTGASDIIRFLEFTTYTADRIVQNEDGKELVYTVNGVADELRNRTQFVRGEIRLDDDGYFSSVNATVKPKNTTQRQIQISVDSVGSTTVNPPDWLSDANQTFSSKPEVSTSNIPEVVSAGEESEFQISATTANKTALDLEYIWRFGNNNTERGLKVSNTYENTGSYQVQVVIRNPDSNQSTTITRNISVVPSE